MNPQLHSLPLTAQKPGTLQGLDPGSRQILWHVIQEAKRDRGIILTTHRWAGVPHLNINENLSCWR